MGDAAGYSMLVNLFWHLRIFLKRLKIYIAISRTTEISKLLGNVMAHLLLVLSLSTKALKQNPISRYIRLI